MALAWNRIFGCDGGRSTVRTLLGVGFPGEPSQVEVLLGEVELTAPQEEVAAVMADVRERQVLFGAVPLDRGTYRVIVTAEGEPVFLEVNVAPGMTETSAVPLAIEAAGWSLGKMCADLVRAALARSDQPVPAAPEPRA